MSLGENIQFLRKKDNITQEQLAEMLEVSRQSVSKWESDATYPEMDKLLQISSVFHCTLDDLIRTDISTQYIEDNAHYDAFWNKASKKITFGVGLILFGLSFILFLNAIFSNISFIDELSGMIFIIFVTIAVPFFIITGIQSDHFTRKHPYIEDFYSEEEKEKFHQKFIVMITTGVILILIGIILMIGLTEMIPDSINENSIIQTDDLIASFFLLIITISVSLFVYAGMQNGKYNIKHYNLMHDHDSVTYKNDKKTGMICACLMMTATIIYLILGFVWNMWYIAPAIFAPFGIACGIVSIIINRNNNEE